jgi:hypothetical protein
MTIAKEQNGEGPRGAARARGAGVVSERRQDAESEAGIERT